MLLAPDILRPKFRAAMTYAEFVASGEPEGHRPPWDERYGRLALKPAQDALVQSFTRSMNVLCLTGTWCGDCALQGSAMARIAEANPDKIDLKFLPRQEDHADLIVKAPINAGFRVPVTWFMAEDFEPAVVFGDRTLSRYRAMARKQLPPEQANVLAPAPEDPVREVLHEVLDMFERVQLLLRLSPRLREKHGD
jgi:hypothetical protein